MVPRNYVFSHLRPQARDKHRTGVIGFLEAAVLIEGKLLVVGNNDYAQVVLVDFLDMFHEFLANALALVFFSLNDNSTY